MCEWNTTKLSYTHIYSRSINKFVWLLSVPIYHKVNILLFSDLIHFQCISIYDLRTWNFSNLFVFFSVLCGHRHSQLYSHRKWIRIDTTNVSWTTTTTTTTNHMPKDQDKPTTTIIDEILTIIIIIMTIMRTKMLAALEICSGKASPRTLEAHQWKQKYPAKLITYA